MACIVSKLKESKESLDFLEFGVFQEFLVGMEEVDLRGILEKKDFQVFLEERDQRVIQEIKVSLVTPSISMEVM